MVLGVRAARRAVAAVGAMLVMVPFVVAVPLAAAIPSGGMTAASLNAAFTGYGNTSGKWNGADSTASVPLPDGRVAWLFSDTFLGPVNADGTRPRTSPMVHNSLVVQDGTALVDTRTGGTSTFPASLVGANLDSQSDNAGYWVGDGTVENTTLSVLYNHYRKTGSGGLDVALTGTSLASFDLPGLSPRSLVDLPVGATTAWGSSIMVDGGYTYVYGTESTDQLKFAHLARTAAGLGGAWQFWTGSGWSGTEADSARLLSGVGTAFSVRKIGAQYVLVTMEANLPFNPQVVAYTADSPAGPFAGPVQLFTTPEPQPGRALITYDTRLHQELAAPGKLLVSYNVNSLASDDNYADASIYRPRFVDVDWPRPVVADPPAAPTGLAASVDADGVVTLNWQPTAAGRYWVYQRDVTAGQTHVARFPGGTTDTTMQLTSLRSGHQYEFSVSAQSAAGEGPRSAPVSVTVTVPAPAAPTGVAVSANDAGQVTVTWQPVPRVWNYQVFKRDVTAGETEFQPMSKVGGDTTSQTLDWLANNHQYELYVVAVNGGGTSAPSASQRITTRYPVPPAPSGLTATPNSDGGIALHWNAPAPGLWYVVYQKDITAGDADYTKLPLPVANGTDLNAGFLINQHTYEYVVSAMNPGGESARSAPARATSAYPLPAAPANLRATAGAAQVTLTWDATAPDHWYWVYQRDVTAGETDFTRLPIPISGGTTMTAGYLTNTHTYEFAVSAIGSGVEGPKSAPVQATPNVAPPGQVTGLTATPGADGSITLNWTAPGPDVYYWIYQRDATAGAAWQKLQYPVTDGTTFRASLLTHQHAYEFKVAATNSGGDGPTSAVVGATAVYQIPAAPTNLRGSTDGDGGVNLDWDGPAGLYYWVYYRDVTAGESFTKSAYPTDKTAASMGMLRSGHVYEFKVTAQNQGGEGPASATVQVTPVGGLPIPPSGLSAEAGDGKVILRWNASSTPNVLYWIEYRANGGSWQRLQYPYNGCCSFTVDYLGNGTNYDFRLRSTNYAGDSAPSNVASAKPMPPLPAAPGGLSASAGDGSVTLNWTASSTPNVLYWIDYRANGGSWQRLKYPLSTCCSFTVGYLMNGTRYDFRVIATNLSGDGPASNVASARPMPPFPQPPSGLSVTPGLGKATLHWSASPTHDVYYWLEYRADGGAWQRAVYPVGTCCSFTMDYLTGNSYEFRVRATNLAGDSTPSNTVGVSMPLPPAPTNVRAAQAGPYQAKLTWDPVPGADAYIIYHGVGSAQWSFPPMTALPYPVMGGNTTSFTADYLTEFGIHFWSVAAVKFGRVGPQSGLTTMAPLMENTDYWTASAVYLHPYNGMSKTVVLHTGGGGQSSDLFVARAFISSGDWFSNRFKDRGSFSDSGTAPARAAIAYDPGGGLVGLTVNPTCPLGVACKSALPIQITGPSIPVQDECGGTVHVTCTTSFDSNKVGVTNSSGGAAFVAFQLADSYADVLGSGFFVPGAIDGSLNVVQDGRHFDVTLRADKYPSWEVVRIPHWTTLGMPDNALFGTAGQSGFDGLCTACYGQVTHHWYG